MTDEDIPTPESEDSRNGFASNDADSPAKTRERRASPSEPRFHIFVVDSRWNSVATRVLQENMSLVSDLNRDDPVYVLDRDASVDLLSEFSWQIGRDPIICVHDLQLDPGRGKKHAHGFRMHLGRLRTEAQALAALQQLSRFIKENRAHANVEAAVRKTLLLGGLSGAIQIMRARPTTATHDDIFGIS